MTMARKHRSVLVLEHHLTIISQSLGPISALPECISTGFKVRAQVQLEDLDVHGARANLLIFTIMTTRLVLGLK